MLPRDISDGDEEDNGGGGDTGRDEVWSQIPHANTVIAYYDVRKVDLDELQTRVLDAIRYLIGQRIIELQGGDSVTFPIPQSRGWAQIEKRVVGHLRESGYDVELSPFRNVMLIRISDRIRHKWETKEGWKKSEAFMTWKRLDG